MKATSVSEEEKRNARAAGFKRKKPKKPKSRTIRSMESYIERYNAWAKLLKEKAKEGKKITDMKKTVTGT